MRKAILMGLVTIALLAPPALASREMLQTRELPPNHNGGTTSYSRENNPVRENNPIVAWVNYALALLGFNTA